MEEVGVEVAPLSEEEVAVEVAPLSEEEAEETREDEPAETPTPGKSRIGIPEVTGKRTKKTVARLEIQMAMPKEKLKVEDGGGDKLGDIPRTNHMIGKLKPGDLKPLHSIMFDRPGKVRGQRKNMRQFNGFPFEVNSKQFTKKRDKLWASLTNLKLRAICKVLDLEQKGSQVDLINRILIFLSAPKNSGKPLLSKKKKKSKKRLSAGESKPRPKSTSASPKKTKSGSKSKAIVMESSSDEDEEDEDDKAGARAEEEDDDEEEEEEEAEEEEEEAKESGIEKSDESEDDGDEEDLEDEEEVIHVGWLFFLVTAAQMSEGSSGDDRPLIKMMRVAPSDGQLEETVRGLLKDADLEEVTMKQICQKVYDAYPDHDLASRKDFIKQTIKSVSV
uniref:DEK proto-oncogene n=1 Tax=Gadus morhua TaxID=8049 RepID=A0A8C4Z5R2_GADMO